MALDGKHSLPGFEQSLGELRADILLMAALVRRTLTDARSGQMEPLAESARDLMEKFSDDVGKNPERSGFYVSLIVMARSLEQIIYLIESITEDIVYVAEVKDIRHSKNRLAVENEQ